MALSVDAGGHGSRGGLRIWADREVRGEDFGSWEERGGLKQGPSYDRNLHGKFEILLGKLEENNYQKMKEERKMEVWDCGVEEGGPMEAYN